MHIKISLLQQLLLTALVTATSSTTTTQQCEDATYSIHLLSQDPLVIYLPNFITDNEALHLRQISEGKFTKSEVADEFGHQRNATTRNSRSQSLESDAVVQCIEARALAFQGFDVKREQLEPIQLVKYNLGENYDTHTDWFEAASRTTDEFGGNRASSFFAYVVADDVTGGGTNFPMLQAPKDDSWCQYINCDEPWEAGTTFRPIPRNAVYWRNLDNSGRGNTALLHSGLPLTSGTKIGMNIWTRQRPLASHWQVGPRL